MYEDRLIIDVIFLLCIFIHFLHLNTMVIKNPREKKEEEEQFFLGLLHERRRQAPKKKKRKKKSE